MRRSLNHLAAARAVLALLALAAPAAAQGPTPTTLDFELEPLVVESIGLSVNVPLDSNAQTTWIGQLASVQIVPPDAAWVIDIKSAEPKDPDITPTEFADAVIEQLRQSSGNKDGLFARNSGARVGDRPADTFYYRFPPIGTEPSRVFGYAIVANAPRRVLTFILRTTDTNLAQARLAFEGVLASAVLTDPVLGEAKRALAIANGDRLLATLTPETLAPFLTGEQDRWERLFRPADTNLDSDAKELGYRRQRVWRGQRGEMDPTRAKSQWHAADQDQGYLVKVDSRLLLENEIVDASSTYFLSLDRSQEAWKTTMAIKPRNGAKPAVWTEVGARVGTSLNVKTSGAGEPPQTITAEVPESGYLSQVESTLMGDIIARLGETGDYGFYTYRPARNRILYRVDRLEPAGSEGGRRRLVSVHEPGQQPLVTVYDADAEPLSQALPDGRIWQPITVDRLYQLWKGKGLPVQ